MVVLDHETVVVDQEMVEIDQEVIDQEDQVKKSSIHFEENCICVSFVSTAVMTNCFLLFVYDLITDTELAGLRTKLSQHYNNATIRIKISTFSYPN